MNKGLLSVKAMRYKTKRTTMQLLLKNVLGSREYMVINAPVKITSDMRSEVGGFPYRAQKLGQQESEPQARGKMDVLC